jgi:large subunit ribosomal protein L21
MTYAIIELGGKQYRVEEGDSVVVDRVAEKEGAKITARALLYNGNGKTVMDGPDLEKVKVEAVVAEHLKGEKLRVFKYRPKKRYRRRSGHRSLLTRLEISGIKAPAAAKASPAAKTAAGAAKSEAEPKAKEEPAKKTRSATQSGRSTARKSAPRKTTKES